MQEWEELIEKYIDVFATESSDCGQTDRMVHHIHAGETQLIRQPLRRLPLVKQADLGNVLKDVQQCGVIKESDSPRLSPIILIQKRMGTSFSV